MDGLILDLYRQYDRIWAAVSPNKVSECRTIPGSTCIAWTGMIDGKQHHVVSFEDNVSGEVYIGIFQNTIWPSVRGSATRKQ